MPQVTYDGQSFSIDGRRIWLVSGAIHYARVPRELWRDRIRAAKQAGLNCIETYVFWNIHEAKPGRFDFDGDRDLRHFVELIHEEGLYCILRPGPYICAEWDNGGLPPWLPTLATPKLGPVRYRQGDQRFLEASSRYLSAVMNQVKDLQITTKTGGPIVLMQAENEWFCHNPLQAKAYLREVVRYLRENGCQVPIFECNNLWQRIEGALSAWNGNVNLAADLRQFRQIQNQSPRLVSEFWPGWFDSWGSPRAEVASPEVNEFRLAQILASGAQYNLYMFHGGTNFAFNAGRSVESPDCYITTSYDYQAPLGEGGRRGPAFAAVKRISTFASQFAHVLANLDPASHPTCIATDGHGGGVGEDDHPVSVVRQAGTQGDVVFLFKSASDKTTDVRCLLPDGRTVDVPLGEDRVAWFVTDVNLGGVAQLSHSSLRPWAFTARKLLVLFGPPGANGLVSINDSPLQVTVPTGKTPHVEPFEDITIAVLSKEQVDAAHIADDGRLFVGVAALDEEDNPVPLKGWPSHYLIDPDGTCKRVRQTTTRAPAAPKITQWDEAPLSSMLTGESSEFKEIDGPTSLEDLACNFGYGWYRIDLPKAATAKALLAPAAADRLHLFSDAQSQIILGQGPGAQDQTQPYTLSERTVILADNLGRFCYGWRLGEPKGIWDHLYDVEPIKLDKPKIERAEMPDPTPLGGFFTGIRFGQRGPASSLTWTFQYHGRSADKPLILEIDDLSVMAMITLNDHPIGMYSRDASAHKMRYILPVPDVTKRGKNTLQLTLFHPYQGKSVPAKSVTVYQAQENLTAKAKWSFAPWAPPKPAAFNPIANDQTTPTGLPTWYRGTFRIRQADTPFWLEPNGLTKGQIYLNGHNVGRYFVAAPNGKSIAPQKRYYLPEPWLRTDADNELILFEEHGHRPHNKIKLARG